MRAPPESRVKAERNGLLPASRRALAALGAPLALLLATIISTLALQVTPAGAQPCPGEALHSRPAAVLRDCISHLPLAPPRGAREQVRAENPESGITGGSGAQLPRPSTCGTRLAAAHRDETRTQSRPALKRVSGCTQLMFDPSFLAGTISDRAGAFSPETVTISRSGEDEEFRSIALQNPPGLLGMLSAVGLCSGAPALNGSCPAKSQIGTVSAGLGPVFSPFALGGGVFLTGPYGGEPFGLVIEVPVGIGLFDIGEVIVRAALTIDPSSAALSINSDPLPQSFDGIPLQLRSIHLDLDRRGFIFNPTSCKLSSIAATVTGTAGSIATESSPFRAVDCGSLRFKPRLGLRLSGATHRGAHPKLGAVLTMAAGGANIKRATVTLPSTELIDSAHLPNPCTATQFATRDCPSSSVIGHARVETPMLKAPLAGPVYLRSSSQRLPEFVAVLGGQLEFDLNGRLATGKGGGVRASFGSLPDVPISKFTLSLAGGRKGLLVNSMNLCSSASRAAVKLGGQNGKAVDSKSAIANSCPGKAKGRHAH